MRVLSFAAALSSLSPTTEDTAEPRLLTLLTLQPEINRPVVRVATHSKVEINLRLLFISSLLLKKHEHETKRIILINPPQSCSYSYTIL